ncbi:MAG: 30S ribosomal protein S12 methylthiotransferase RimO, partial [Leptolyngbyaceae cyanobacterium]
IYRINEALPESTLRSTFIVGVPGETEAHFEHLLIFVERHEFDHVGVFTYSAEEGTPAFELPNQIPQGIMDERREALMLAQQAISLKRNQQQVGQIVPVLIEQAHPGTGELVGRSARFAPDVDGLVYIKGDAPLGQMRFVTIESADAYDLQGSLVPSAELITTA